VDRNPGTVTVRPYFCFPKGTRNGRVGSSTDLTDKKGKAVPLHAMEALGRRGGIAPTHSRPRH
jgi:hypothetical protein